MRKIVAGLFMALDGVVESPMTWSGPYFTQEMVEVMSAGIAQADAVVLGRRTYQEFAEIWPKQEGSGPMANFLNNAPKYVFSKTLDKVEWKNSTLVKGNVAAELGKLKQLPGKNIQVPGSPRLVRSLLCKGLLDDLTLFILPIVVGTGMRLFDDMIGQVRLKLAASKTFSNSVLSATYQPATA